MDKRHIQSDQKKFFFQHSDMVNIFDWGVGEPGRGKNQFIYIFHVRYFVSISK